MLEPKKYTTQDLSCGLELILPKLLDEAERTLIQNAVRYTIGEIETLNGGKNRLYDFSQGGALVGTIIGENGFGHYLFKDPKVAKELVQKYGSNLKTLHRLCHNNAKIHAIYEQKSTHPTIRVSMSH